MQNSRIEKIYNKKQKKRERLKCIESKEQHATTQL